MGLRFAVNISGGGIDIYGIACTAVTPDLCPRAPLGSPEHAQWQTTVEDRSLSSWSSLVLLCVLGKTVHGAGHFLKQRRKA